MEPDKKKLKALTKESQAVARGEKTAHRVTELVKQPDGTIKRVEINPEAHREERARAWEAKTYAARVRHSLNLTQKAFAELLDVALPTLRKWEQPGNEPKGAALKLLKLAEKHPEILKTL